MITTHEGKWVLFTVATGDQREYWPIDARVHVANGTHSTEPPVGVQPVMPVKPPTHANAPVPAVARTFVTEEGTSPPTRAPRPRKE